MTTPDIEPGRVEQVLVYKTSDGVLFEEEDDALTHQILINDKIMLVNSLSEVWYSHIPMSDVIDKLLEDFTIHKKD